VGVDREVEKEMLFENKNARIVLNLLKGGNRRRHVESESARE